jgi:hypothetical protein
MTRTFSDIDDIGGTPHLVENRFRLNGAAAPRAQPPQDPAQRAELPGEIADARRHAPPPPLVLSTAARPS